MSVISPARPHRTPPYGRTASKTLAPCGSRRALGVALATLFFGTGGCGKFKRRFQGIDITGADYARDFLLPDANGVDRSLAELTATLKEPNTSKMLVESQQMNLRMDGPEVLRTFLAKEIKTWGDVVRDNNINGG